MADPMDPVCGMVVLPESAQGKAEFQATTYYFCSDQCMRDFQNDPAKYADAPNQSGTDSASPEAESAFTTKGIFTTPKFGSAVSGGGNLEPPSNKER